MACGPNCQCQGKSPDHRHGSSNLSGVGFAFGVALGAAAGAVLAADPKTRKQAKRKLDQLVGDATPDVLESVKEVAAQVIDDIRGDAAQTVMRSRVKRTKPATRK